MVPVAQGVAWDVIVRMGETEAELCFFERNTLVILLLFNQWLVSQRQNSSWHVMGPQLIHC